MQPVFPEKNFGDFFKKDIDFWKTYDIMQAKQRVLLFKNPLFTILYKGGLLCEKDNQIST